MGKGPVVDGFHGNGHNYLIYVYYQYIIFPNVKAGN